MKDKEINIHNLTPHQIEMLDILWAFEDYEDVVKWQQTLGSKDKKLSQVLLDLVILELVDGHINDSVKEDFSETREYLKKFML